MSGNPTHSAELQTPSVWERAALPRILRGRSRFALIGGRRRRIVNAAGLSTIWQTEIAFGDTRYAELSPRARIAFHIVADHLDKRRRQRAEDCRLARERRERRWALIATGRLELKERDVAILHDQSDRKPSREFARFVDEYVDAELQDAA